MAFPAANKTGPRKILLVDDNDVFRDALKVCLEEAGYGVDVANNGQAAKEILCQEKSWAVVSDIQMSPVNGIELLEFVKTQENPAPVILMTGFSDLLETQQAYTLGAAGFLGKPFKGEELLQLLEKVLAQPNGETSLEPLDSQFCKLGIDDFISGHQIKFDIFIRLSESKYVKLANEGENIPLEKIQLYKNKGLLFLYMRRDDFKNYIGFNLLLAPAVVGSKTVEKAKKLNFLKHTQEVILEEIFSDELNEENFKYASAMTETTVSLLSESKDLFEMLEMMNNHADFLYAHSLAVSLYAVMIARELKWTTPINVFKVAMGGLLHDIGKKEIPKAIITKARKSMTPDEIGVFETHPARGMEILSKIKGMPTDVAQICSQHHETIGGSGYPSHLKKQQIHPMARLVAVANEFCGFVIKGPDSPGLKPTEAMEQIRMLYGDQLDAAFLSALGNLVRGPVKQKKAG